MVSDLKLDLVMTPCQRRPDVHLMGNPAVEAYVPHQCELKLPNKVFKCAQRAFLVEPLINDDFPGEFKHVVTTVVD